MRAFLFWLLHTSFLSSYARHNILTTNVPSPLYVRLAVDDDGGATDLRMENAMRALRRMRRDAELVPILGPFAHIVNKTRSPRSSVVVLEASSPHQNGDQQNGGRCVLSSDQAVQFCGFAEEVSTPPIPPPKAGSCHQSAISSREICYPRYEQLDTTCTDAGGDRSALVAPPIIPHATVRTMAFVPPDNLNRLIRQYYRQQGRHLHRNESVFDVERARSFLFVKYHCEYGYEMLDEADTMFCQNKQWVQTKPVCRGKGLCEKNNGGCSHSCLSLENQTLKCRCPKGMILDTDEKTCIKPVPKNLCRKLAGCRCSPIDVNVQYTCACQNEAQKCLLLRGPPKIYLEPDPPFEVEPGGNLNITCAAVAFPFPRIYWQRENEEINGAAQKSGTVKSEQVLMIKEIYKNTEFTCHAENQVGTTKRVLNVVVTGPGSAPIIRAVNAARTSIETRWDPPHTLNRPVTSYEIYFTENQLLPIRDWQREIVQEPSHEASIKSLKPDTTYTIRIRASDSLGPGKLSNPVSITTQKAAIRPSIHIVEGEEFRVAPKTSFTLNCNVTHGDPTPSVQWESRGRPISAPQKRRLVTLEHVGLYENADFICVAENEAGKINVQVAVIVTGPTAPERIRYHVDGNQILLQWEPPRITNGPMKDYEVLYTDDPSLPETEWRSVNSGGTDAMSVALTNLRELTEYTVKVRGENINGVGLPSLDFTVKTWLAPRKPAVQLTPATDIRKSPSTEKLTIMCESDGIPRPRIFWLWNGALVEDGRNGFRVYDVTPIDAMERTQSKLQTHNSTRSGQAECRASNAHGVDTKRVTVKILGPGSAPEAIHPTPAEDGFHLHWRPPVVPNGNINKYVIYYTKDADRDLVDWSTTTVNDANTTSTTVSNQDEDTPYVVRLQAVNDDGPGIISDSYEVITGQKHIPLKVMLVVTSPDQLADLSDQVGTVVEPRQSIRFKCIAEGRPKPTVFYSWLPFNGTESGQEPIYMTLNPVGKPTQHRYETDSAETSTETKRSLLCEARNIHGSATDNRIFNVLKPGSPPEEISSLVDPDNKVTINWKPTIHPNGDVKKYHVYLSADPSKLLEEWKRFDAETSPQPSLEFKRGDLEPETPYYVRIAAVNDNGEGVPSEPTYFMTQSGAPLDAPTDVLAEVAPDNSVNISWTGPSQPNGPIKSYTVYFTPEDPGELGDDAHKWPKVVIESTDSTGRVTLDRSVHNLLPDHDYKVRVTATNDQSEGPFSSVVRFTTGSGEVAPTILLSPVDNPVSVAPQSKYTVNCSATGVPPPSVFWTIGESNHVPGPILHIGPLIKDTTATCMAENNAGKAQETLNIQVSGPGTPPNEIVVIPMINPEGGEQEINVEWTAPDETNGKIINYIVHYGIVPDGELEPREWQQQVVTPEKDLYKLTNLLPKSKYQVKVQAVSDRGPGVVSLPHAVTTLPRPPKTPEKPNVIVHDNNTVQLEFAPAVDPNDPTGKTKIKDYKILYTTGDPLLEETKWKELIWTLPDSDLVDAEEKGIVSVPIDGENFDPESGYKVKLVPLGEIDGLPTDPVVFQTSDGIIAPDAPVINIALPPNKTIRVPAGADYTVSCTANGFPAPNITWVDNERRRLSDFATLRLFDIKTTQRTKCVAQNIGGISETPFVIYVAGPGNAPENIRLLANKPKTIDVSWNPPSIPNGNITRYIIYYTPLDDQKRIFQVGQVPKKPIYEWLTYHAIGDNLNEGEKHAALTDFVASDTAYAVVIQAVNEDGPGPYSEQNSIRTISKVREQPPKELRVEPLNQTSVRVRWRPAEGADQVAPIAYELYYIVGDREIEKDEYLSLPKWTKVAILDGKTLSYNIENALAPDTEYVFKIRAIYESGPGVFSKPCITKTLPEGDVPFIVVSAGAGGIAGTAEVSVLPGSGYNVFCKASGHPLPSVKWIRAGNTPIDPSTVKSEDSSTKWSLNVANLTDNATFVCVAQNQLGVANWTIKLDIIEDLPPNWEMELVTAENRDGIAILSFSDKIPNYLKNRKHWVLRYTDDATKPIDAWRVEESADRPLEALSLPGLEPGVTYHMAIENPTDGIRSPVVTFLVPKPPSDIRVVPNIDNDIIVNFRPALSSTLVEKYLIRYWPFTASTDNAATFEVGSNSTTGNIVRDLPLDTEHKFQVTAVLSDGKTLPSDVISITTPTDENEAGKVVRVECSCPDNFQLEDDGKTCIALESENTNVATVQVSSTFNPLNELDQPREVNDSTMQSSPLPTDASGRIVSITPSADEYATSAHPTDELGREIHPIVFFNGSLLPTDEAHTAYDQLGRPVTRDDDQSAIGPDGKPLRRNDDGNFVYPPLDQYQQPLPTDANFRPIYKVANADGIVYPQNADGLALNENGSPFPTNSAGQPVAPDGSPLPTDYYGRFVVLNENANDDERTVLPTDAMGYQIFPIVDIDGKLLPTSATGAHVYENGEEIERNEQGFPVDKNGQLLEKNYNGQYVWPARSVRNDTAKNLLKPDEIIRYGSVVTSTKLPIRVIDGSPKSTDAQSHFLGSDEADTSEQPLDSSDKAPLQKKENGSHLLPTQDPSKNQNDNKVDNKRIDSGKHPSDDKNQDILATLPKEHETTPVTPRKLPTDDYERTYRLVDSNGIPLPTDSLGRYFTPDNQLFNTDEFDRPIDGETGSLLPKNSNGDYIYKETGSIPTAPKISTIVATATPETPTVSPVVVDSYGNALPIDAEGWPLYSNGERVAIDSLGRYLNTDGLPITPNSKGEIVVNDKVTRLTTSTTLITITSISPVVIYSYATGEVLPTDSNGRFLDTENKVIPIDDHGRPLDHNGQILPTNSKGEYIYRKPIRSDTRLAGRLSPTNVQGNSIGFDEKILPTNEHGIMMGPDGSPIPIDIRGEVLDGSTTAGEKTLPTDESGKLIYPIVDEDGTLLKQNNFGRYLDFDGNEISTDDIGRPLNSDNNVLPTNTDGNYVYVQKTKDVTLTPKVKSVIDSDGKPLPSSVDGMFINVDGSPLPTNRYGELIDSVGSPFPIDENGVVKIEKGKKLPTDDYGRLVYSVIHSDGTPFEKDNGGNYVNARGESIPVDDFGRPLTSDGVVLPTNSLGDYVYVDQPKEDFDLMSSTSNSLGKSSYPSDMLKPTKSEPTDATGRRIHSLVSPDGSPLPQDDSGQFTNAKGEAIKTDDEGRPLDDDGNVLPMNEYGDYIYKNPKRVIVVTPDDQPLPTLEGGSYVDANGNVLPTNSIGDYVNTDGLPLPTNSDGNLVYLEESKNMPPTDSSGKIVYPVVDSYGILLPKDSFGRHVDPDGDQIPTDDFGKPLDNNGNILPTDKTGNFVYTRASTPATTLKKFAVDTDGMPMPTDHTGNFVDKQGSPYPTNSDGLLIGPDGSPWPTNTDGASIVNQNIEYNAEVKTLPTDETGKVVHPIVGEDGELMPTDKSGRFVGVAGEEIQLDEQGRPLNVSNNGEILPTNSNGEFVYISQAPIDKTVDPWDYDSDSAGNALAYPKDSDANDALHKNKKCQIRSAAIDIIIAVNNQLFQERDNEKPIKRAIERLLKVHLDLAPDHVRVAILQYGRGVLVPVNLGGYHERDEVLERVHQLGYNEALSTPELSTAYRAAAQQYRSFGRHDSSRLIIVFTAGEDIGSNNERHVLDSLGASVILVGLNRYDTEIQDESRFHVLINDWSTSHLAIQIVRHIETQCLNNNLRLAPLDQTSTTIKKPNSLEPEEIIIDETKKLDQQEMCEKLQTRTRLILAVETSDATESQKGELQRLLFNFLRNYVEKTGTLLRIGIIFYGKTAEVAVDIGNYRNMAELEEAIEDMHFVGGAADSVLALRTARQLFDEQRDEKGAQDESLWKTDSDEAERKEKDAKEKAENDKKRRKEIKIVFHVHRTALSSEAMGEAEKNRREIGAAIINFDEAKWRLLESAESFWRKQICLMQSMVDTRLGREDAASADMLSDAFFRAGPDASPLPTDESGQIIMPTTKALSDDESGGDTPRILPTDESGKFVYPVVNEDGKLMPTDDAGRYVDALGDSIQTDDFGRPTDEKGEILPVNRNGDYVLTGPRGNRMPATKPTSIYGDDITVMGADGVPLLTNALGQYVDADNQPLPTNVDGYLVDAFGSALPINPQGQIVVATKDDVEAVNRALPTDDNGRFIYPVVYKNGKPLRTDDSGRYVDIYGDALPVDDFGRPLDEAGNLLPTNKYGQYIYPHTERPLQRSTISTTTIGRNVKVIGPDGLPVSTDVTGRIVDRIGKPLPTNSAGSLLGPNGSPLPTNTVGQLIIVDASNEDRYDKLVTDSSGRVVYPVVDDHGNYLKTDSNGRYLDDNDDPIALDDSGRPLDRDGNVLLQDNNGRYIYKAKPKKVSAIGFDGLPLATDSSGRLVDHFGHPYPTDYTGALVGLDGSPLPTNAQGEYVVLPEDETTVRTLPTDDYGRNIYPVVDADGRLLPTNAYGQHITENNEPIATNEFGHPVSDDGEVLTTNSRGEYIYSSLTPSTPPRDKTVSAVDAYGRLLPTDANGIVLDVHGNTYPTNSAGLLISIDGSPLPKNSDGKYVINIDDTDLSKMETRTDKAKHPLPTDEYGKIIYPIVRSDGNLLAKDESGHYVDARGEIIPIDDFGRPLNEDGQPLPTNSVGDFVYSDRHNTPYNIVGSDNQPLPTDSSGRHLSANGEPIPTDTSGRSLDADGLPLPMNSHGDFVLDETKLQKKKKVPLIGLDGQPLPMDHYGNIVDRTTKPSTWRVRPDHSLSTLANNEVTQIGTDATHQTVLLPTDSDSSMPAYRIVGVDGLPLAKNADDKYVDFENRPIALDKWGRPLDERGDVLPKNTDGDYVFNSIKTTPQFSSYDDDLTAADKSPYTVIDNDGRILPRNEQGRFVSLETGEPIPVDEYGRPVDLVTGNLLPRNSAGDYIYTMPADKPLEPVTTTDNSLELANLQKENDKYLSQRRNDSVHCFLGGFVEILFILDASSNVKILDYRLMKEAAKDFLVSAFDLRPNRARIGLIKYGEHIEVPVALGDYDGEDELLMQLGEARRLKGVANLGDALRESASEFILSGSQRNPPPPRFVIIWKNGNSTGRHVHDAAITLQNNFNAKLFIVTVAESDEDLFIVGSDHPERILRLRQWRAEASELGKLADQICELAPKAINPDLNALWPQRRPATMSTDSADTSTCQTIDHKMDVIITLDSSNFNAQQFATIIEGVGTLVDESFDLAPDVVRIGFVVYSDQVSVPVALGHYEDKIELLEKIVNAEKLGGSAIALRGLEATRRQFQLHGRESDKESGNPVTRVVLLITNGKHRGNAANAALEMREKFGVQIFAVAVAPLDAQYASLSRIVGQENLAKRLLKISSVHDLTGERLSFVRHQLCARISSAAAAAEVASLTTEKQHHTVKRDLTHILLNSDESAKQPEPICKDNILRPYLVSVIVDVTSKASHSDFKSAATLLANYFKQKFGVESQLLRLNLITVDSNQLLYIKQDIAFAEFFAAMKHLRLNRKFNDKSAKLGLAMEKALTMMNEQFITGVNQLTIILSADGFSSDKIVSTQNNHVNHIISVSIKQPHSDLLKKLAGGSSTRVIHFANWTENADAQFERWLSFAICSVVHSNTAIQSTTATYAGLGHTLIDEQTSGYFSFFTRAPKWKSVTKASARQPNNVVLTPISATALAVSWTCCSDQSTDYVILYSPDSSLPKHAWRRINVTCNDAYGTIIDELPTRIDYHACIISAKANESFTSENCDSVYLSPESVAPGAKEFLEDEKAKRLTNSKIYNDHAKKKVSEKCPQAGLIEDHNGNCIDVDECAKENGGCSHGCINTLGGYYCACPHGMMRDLADPTGCIKVAGSFERIAELLAQYLYANVKSSAKLQTTKLENDALTASDSSDHIKASIKSTEDSRKLDFEWPTNRLSKLGKGAFT